MSIFEYNEAEEKEKMLADGLAEQIPRLSKDADFLQEMMEKYMV